MALIDPNSQFVVHLPPASGLETRSGPESIEKLANPILTNKKECNRQCKRRKIVAAGLAPSTVRSDNLNEAIKQHAYMRIQLFFLTVCLMYGIAVRSDGNLRKINLSIGPADLQVGKGTKDFHAAHMNALAGLKDNCLSIMTKEIHEENVITPSKKKILEKKGFDALDPASMLALLSENKASMKSLFEGTRLKYTLNATTELPRAVNLSCDKALEEYIRPKVLGLLQSIIREELDPKEACKDYCRLVSDHFAALEKQLKKAGDLIESYQTVFQGLKNHQILTDQEIIDILNQLNSLGIAEVSEDLPKLKMKSNTKFLKTNLYAIQQDPKKGIEKTRNWLDKRLGDLEKEIQTRHQFFKETLEYCILEKTGTQLPDFDQVLGEQGLSTPEKLQRVQENLLKAITPTKDLALSMTKKIVSRSKKKLEF